MEEKVPVKNNVPHIISLALRGVAMAMAVAAVVIGAWKAAPAETIVVMLGIGLFTPAPRAMSFGGPALAECASSPCSWNLRDHEARVLMRSFREPVLGDAFRQGRGLALDAMDQGKED